MAIGIRRRQFISALGGAAVVWPLAARAQQGGAVRRIGVLIPLAPDDPVGQAQLGALRQGLQEVGWTIGHDMQVEIRWNVRDPDSVRKSAAELLALAPDVIVSVGSEQLGPLLQITRTIPIVFVVVSDPVGAGFVESLARPGGNATGFSQPEYGTSTKLLELLKEIAPGVTRAAVLRDSTTPNGIGQFGAIQAMAPSLGVEVIVATPALRSQFGPRLATVYAPLLLASFGTGAQRIDIRYLAPGGTAARAWPRSPGRALRTICGGRLFDNGSIRQEQTRRGSSTASRPSPKRRSCRIPA